MTPAGARQAAHLMLLLEEEQAADLLRDLDPPEVEAIAAAMLALERVEPGALAAAAGAFLAVGERHRALDVTPQPPQALLARAVGAERAALVASRHVVPSPGARVASLQWLDAPTLAAALDGEHPQFIAATLALAPPELGAAALAKLSAEAQPNVLRRIATMRPLSSEALADIEAHLAAHIGREVARDEWQTGGPTAVSKLLANVGRSTQARLIAALGGSDPALSRMLADNLFTFDDVAKLESRALQLVLREIDADTLTAALKGSDAAVRETMLAGMSQRAASSIRDDILNGPPVKVADVQAARKAVVDGAKRLADSGAIEIGRDDD